MPDYQLGKIYKLSSPSANVVYYGSTCEKYICTRLAKHRGDYKHYLKNKNKRRYVTSFKILECEDYKIEILEKYPCNNVKQLKTRERWYIENNDCVNKVIPCRTKKEWAQDNKEHVLEHQREYHKANKDKIKQQTQEYYQSNKDKIKQRVQEYNTNNIDKIKEQQTKYRTNNKDKIKAHANEKIVCECGCEITRSNFAPHKKTQKHINLMAVG